MSLLALKIKIDPDWVERMRELPSRYKRNLNIALQTELAPELQQDMDDLMEEGPPVSTPFQFTTEASRRFYFDNFVDPGGYTDGKHWIRHGGEEGSIETSWITRFDTTPDGLIFTIRNINVKAIYVFGPRVVLGHYITGWPDQLAIAVQLIREKALAEVERLDKQALQDAINK